MTHRAVPARARAGRGVRAAATAFALALAMTACTAGAEEPRADDTGAPSSPSPSPTPVSEASVASNVEASTPVAVDQTLTLDAQDGTFEKVRVTYSKGERLKGKMSKDDTTWTSTQRLEPGLRYMVRTVAVDADGLKARDTTRFSTDDLSLDEQTFPSIAPLEGETVGVGMPVIVAFDVPVTDRASIEKHLSVQTSPHQKGAWHWVNDYEVHFRPKSYWQPGTEVTVDADINSIPAGNGIYGQLSRTTSFDIGDSVVSRVNVKKHQMKVFVNGDMARSIPISAGKKGFETRSGTKVIIEKFRKKRMDAATTGIDRDDPEYYNIADVEYALRVTYSGEFLHAAPWSVGSQGSDNVSHGCVGMSTADAAWLYNITKRGDVVEVTGTDRYMDLYNGYGDWNASFSDYKSGSALT